MSLIFSITKNLALRIRNAMRKENAVSPVVGVMLMIVVTIVIAAVVTLFATGVIGGATEPAPVAALSAVLDSQWKEE